MPQIGGHLPPVRANSSLQRLYAKLRAVTAWDAQDERGAIYYLSQSLVCTMRQKYDHSLRKCNNVEDMIRNISHKGSTPEQTESSDEVEGYRELQNRCRSLPTEWTVIQISKGYRPLATCLTHQELQDEQVPVFLTLFCYSSIQDRESSEPIILRLETADGDEHGKTFFHVLSSIVREVRDGIINQANDDGANHLDKVESHIITVITRLREWLGPWVTLFTGKFRTVEAQHREANIFMQIKDFCSKHHIGAKQQQLLALVARRLDLIDKAKVYALCCCEQLDLEETIVQPLYEFLVDLKKDHFPSAVNFAEETLPVLLIVDELLDSGPWEMINEREEFCRMASFHTLWLLYTAHKNHIKDGYLMVPVQKCQTIINPGNNLEKMSIRLQKFYKEWYPEVSLIVDRTPTPSEFATIFNESDVMIYNGHGNGLQYINGDSIMLNDIKCVTFLFGCDSVRLYPNGLFTEMSGSHLYYNFARCPVVVGALWVLTDFFTDYYSIQLIGSWIPSAIMKQSKKVVSLLDPLTFKSGTIQFLRKSSSKTIVAGSENLLKLMSEYRRHQILPLRMRCAMVCRGLPAKNSCY